ncbi:uncharacterized protein LOC115236347 [Formica exsecta]|uniref:uncharacterized protein LOC115236347 n=1 Tax=Formica exsecta TaxID=72781 RepID=UPI001142CB0C|nr:uncharacterized protein LOC115236347 [Formica exsecta]
MIIHLARKKLDFGKQRDWQNTINNRTPGNMPTMEEFLKFLTDRCNTLRVLNQGKTKQPTSKTTSQKKPDKKIFLTSSECKFCKGSHSIYRCEKLQKINPEIRKKEIISKHLCLNCLESGHYAKECKASSCKKCSKRHNTLLHRDTESQVQDANASNATAIVTYCKRERYMENTQSLTSIDQNERLVNRNGIERHIIYSKNERV